MAQIVKEVVELTEAAREEQIEAYLHSYHPCGYGTSVEKRWVSGTGFYCAKITRWSSCD